MEELRLNKRYRLTIRESGGGEARVVEGNYLGPNFPGFQGIPNHTLGHVFRDSSGHRWRIRTEDVVSVEEI